MGSKVYVNILTPFDINVFTRQLGQCKELEDFIFHENSFDERIWDLVVVYEGIRDKRCLNLRSGRLLFISGEPPHSRVYSERFLNDFDNVITSDKELVHRGKIITQQALPWHYAYNHFSKSFNLDFNALVNMECPRKTKFISIIASSKSMMPGHIIRKKFMQLLFAKYGEKIDFFGLGHNWIDDKSEALDDYMFSICIENSSIDDYWTEKISDAYLAYTVPIYFGCTNLDKYFHPNSYIYIDISNVNKALGKIEEILTSPLKVYENYFPYIIESRNKILFEFNLYTFLKKHYCSKLTTNNSARKVKLKPSSAYFDHHFSNYLLRLKRLFFKICNSCICL